MLSNTPKFRRGKTNLERICNSRQLLSFAAAGVALSLSGRAAQAASSTWTNTGASANWSDTSNWVGAIVPGNTTITTSNDFATFNSAVGTQGTSSTPIVITSGLNLDGIIFDTSSVGSYFIGTTGGNSLLLTNGGNISLTATANTGNQTVNAPLVLEGSNGTYNFLNNSTSTGLLNFGGNITGGASGTTVLTLGGSNTGNNTISGNISNGAAGSISITKSGAGTWNLSGTNSLGTLNVNSGTLAITAGTTNETSTANPNILIGAASSSATFSVSSGATLTSTVNNTFLAVGANTSSVGVLNNAGTVTITTYGGALGHANNASGAIYNTGTFNQNSSTNGLYMANGVGAYGYLYNSGTFNDSGALDVSNNDSSGTAGGTAVVDVTAGNVFVTSAANLHLNSDASSYTTRANAQINVTGGTLTAGNITAGTVPINNSGNAYASINVSGNSAVFSTPGNSTINLNGTSNANNIATLSLANGGTLNTASITNTGSAASTGILSFNNGTLKATAANTLIASGVTAFVESGNGTIDNGGASITIGASLRAPTGNMVTSIALGGTDSGYIGAPVVVITGGGGSGAAAIANFNPTTGNITGITLTSPGSGYTSAPTITLFGGGGTTGTGAAAGAATATASIGNATSGGLTFQGNGTTTLTVANTYTGGTSVNSGTLIIGVTNALASTGAVNVNGGTLGMGTFSDTVGAVTLISGNITGSTGVLTGSSYNLQSGNVSGILGGSGIALIKSTGGSVTISGNESYTGSTTISRGTLSVSGTGSINGSSGITINGSGATFVQNSSVASTPAISLQQGTFNGVGTVGNVTVSSLAANTVTNGNGAGSSVLTVPTLAFSGNGTLLVDVAGGNTTTAGIATTNFITGNTSSGEITVNVTPTANWGIGTTTYNLVSFSGVTGNLSDFTKGTIGLLTSRESATLGLTGGDLTLTIAADAPKWTGLDNGNWTAASTGASHNWKLIVVGTPTDYIDGDTVVFDDSATGNTSVNISSANVSPTAITFNNSSLNYTVSSMGGFGIAGNGTLTKTGNASLTISTANSYSGGTTLSAGTLLLGNATALGSNTVVLAGGTLGFSASGLTYANALNVTGTTILGQDANNTATLSGNLTGNGSLQNFTGGSGSANTVDNLFFTGNLSGFTGTLSYTGSSTNSTAWWRFGMANLSAASVVLNAGTGTVKNFGFTDSTSGATLQIGALSGNGSFQGSFSGGANTLQVGALNSNTIFAGSIGIGTGATANVSLVKVGTGNLTLSGANLYTNTTTVAGGTLSFTGTLANGAGAFTVGNTAATPAILAIASSGTVQGTSLSVGTNATSPGAVYHSTGNLTLTQSAGTGDFQLGAVASSYGYYNLSGGVLSSNEIDIGGYNGGATTTATGVMDVGNGTINDAGWVSLARGVGDSAALNVTGGTINFATNATIVGRLSLNTQNFGGGGSGLAVVNLTNGNITGPGGNSGANGNLNLMDNSGNGADVSAFNLLGGGTLTVNTINASTSSGKSFFNFNGGTLKATATNFGSTFFANNNITAVNVFSGNGTVDNNGSAITIANALVAPAGDGVTPASVSVPSGGAGYIGAPLVTLSGGTGTGATGYAVMSGGAVSSIVITSPGTGYSNGNTLTATFTGGGASTAATAVTGIAVAANTSGGMTFQGNGTTTLTAANTYSGRTQINAGTLALSGNFSNNLANSPAITVASGAVLNVTGLTNTAGTITLAVGQALGGAGTVSGNTTVASGSTISAGTSTALGTGSGNTIATLTTGQENWSGNGTYSWKITGLGAAGPSAGTGGSGLSGNGTGVEGTNWDLLNLTSGTLNLSGLTSANPFKIAPVGTITGNASTYSWVIAQTSGNNTITLPGGYGTAQDLASATAGGGAGALFALSTSGLTDTTSGGSPSASQFSLEAVVLGGHEDLVLDYAGAPEPGTTILVLGGAVPMLIGRRRRRVSKMVRRKE